MHNMTPNLIYPCASWLPAFVGTQFLGGADHNQGYPSASGRTCVRDFPNTFLLNKDLIYTLLEWRPFTVSWLLQTMLHPWKYFLGWSCRRCTYFIIFNWTFCVSCTTADTFIIFQVKISLGHSRPHAWNAADLGCRCVCWNAHCWELCVTILKKLMRSRNRGKKCARSWDKPDWTCFFLFMLHHFIKDSSSNLQWFNNLDWNWFQEPMEIKPFPLELVTVALSPHILATRMHWV